MFDAYNSTLPYRIGFAVAFFTIMGLRDWIKHPENPTRLREYLFLLVAVVVWVLYGVIQDHITATISADYFLQAKGLAKSKYPFRIAVTLLAAKATYGPGALAGALLLIANNPSETKVQLPYSTLFRYCVIGVLLSGVFAIFGGLVCSLIGNQVTWLSEIARAHHIPNECTLGFFVVYGAHTGSYLGGFLGTVLGVVFVARRRLRDDLC